MKEETEGACMRMVLGQNCEPVFNIFSLKLLFAFTVVISICSKVQDNTLKQPTATSIPVRLGQRGENKGINQSNLL